MIYVLSTPEDPHARRVLDVLKARNKPAKLFDVGAVLEQPLRATVSSREGLRSFLDDATAVWFRRVGGVRSGLAEPGASFARREAVSLLLTLAPSLADRVWINPLQAALATDGGAGKLWQLEVARRLGLEVPETLVTNSPDQAWAFVERAGEAIYKPFECPRREDARVIFTQRVDEKHDFASVAHAPCMFQALIPKRADLRAVVVGDRVFCASIDSQAHPDSSVDFRRRYALGETRYEEHVLPDDVRAKLLAAHRALGLVFGAADFVLTPDGRYVFLETNQSGAWLWLQDEVPSLRIAEAIADALSA